MNKFLCLASFAVASSMFVACGAPSRTEEGASVSEQELELEYTPQVPEARPRPRGFHFVRDTFLGPDFQVAVAGNPTGFLVGWEPEVYNNPSVAAFDVNGNLGASIRTLPTSGGNVMNLLGLANGTFGLFSATGKTFVSLNGKGTTLVETWAPSIALQQGSDIYTATVASVGPTFEVQKFNGTNFLPIGTYGVGGSESVWLRSFGYVTGHPVFAGSIAYNGVRDNKLVAYIGQSDGSLTPAEFCLGDTKDYPFYPKYLPLQIVQTGANNLKVLWQDNTGLPYPTWHLTAMTTAGFVGARLDVPYHQIAVFGAHLVGLKWDHASAVLSFDEFLQDGTVLSSTVVGKADYFAHARIAVGGRRGVGIAYDDIVGMLHFTVFSN